MIDFLKSFKSLIKTKHIHTDNNVFKLHYRFTVIILIVFSILLTSKQNFGDPIDCYVDSKVKSVINTYCWIYGTYIIQGTLQEQLLPGLGNYEDHKHKFFKSRTDVDDNQIMYQKYYQWVCIVFCFQALLFYVPRYLWKTWEAGRLSLLVKDIDGPLMTPNWTNDVKDHLVSYIACGKYAHNTYALRFAFCELLNFLNVLVQILLIDWLLTGNFTGYAIGMYTYNNINPMTKVFPKLTKCRYYKYGPSGSLENVDALCVLPLNLVNEKLFLFLWFWFALLVIVTFVQLIYRMIVLLSSRFRAKLLQARCRFLSEKYSEIIRKKLTYGDMFVLDLLGQNMNPIAFKDFVVSLGSCLMEHTSYSYNPEATIVV